jgi:hypothetical protein
MTDYNEYDKQHVGYRIKRKTEISVILTHGKRLYIFTFCDNRGAEDDHIGRNVLPEYQLYKIL